MFQQTVKNFGVTFNYLNETNTVSSGDQLTGHISFDLTKETKITSITLKVTGKANVHWSTGGGKSSRRNYNAKLDFFKLKSDIVQENNAVGETPKYQPGTYVYPFTCQIPQGDLPTSFHGAYGQIIYSITVGIHRPWHMAKDYVAELKFVNHINTNQPELQAPLSGSNNMTLCCLWCASGPITMTASAEKKAFVHGETVKIICKFSNASSRTATPKVTLKEEQSYYTHNRVNRRVVLKNLVSLTGRPVSAHTSDVRTEIPLTIPPTATLTISNCSIISIEHYIQVSLSVRGSPSLTVLFPIILCDTPVTANPPLY